MGNRALTDKELADRILHGIQRRLTFEESINMHVPLTFVGCDVKNMTMEVSYRVPNWARNIHGVLHGGIMATLFDISMGELCRSYTGSNFNPTITLQITYVRPVEIGSILHIQTRVIRAGKSITNMVAEAWTEDGKNEIKATATGTFYMVKDPKTIVPDIHPS